MKLTELHAHSDLEALVKDTKRAFVLLYKKGSEQSDCAFGHLNSLESEEDLPVGVADVSQVRDIHTRYGITSAPSLMVFEGGEYKKSVKGCQGETYYKGLFENAIFTAQSNGKAQKSVIVYSTSTCPHCNNLKEYLRKNKVAFRDIDVSKDQKEAELMVSRSGQQGVPQANINGQVVVGFNKKRINELLELRSN